VKEIIVFLGNKITKVRFNKTEISRNDKILAIALWQEKHDAKGLLKPYFMVRTVN